MHPQVSSSSAVSVPMSGEEDALRSLARERQLSPHAAGATQHDASAPMSGEEDTPFPAFPVRSLARERQLSPYAAHVAVAPPPLVSARVWWALRAAMVGVVHSEHEQHGA